MIVEVFKTNVRDVKHAEMLVHRIQTTFNDYTANFDLDDCDRILRVAAHSESIQVSALIRILKDSGFEADVLPDDIPELLSF